MQATRMREDAAKNSRCLAMARALPGYEEFKRTFRLNEARVGIINFSPESLHIDFRSTVRRNIDAVWWWNPLVEGKPSLAWPDFLAAFAKAEQLVARHPWLAAQKRLPGGRSLELHLLGTGLGESEDSVKNYVLPPWQHAGMQGQPTYSFLARRGRHFWVEFYFSEQDERAFVRSTHTNDEDLKYPKPVSALDRLDLSWHPRGEAGEKYSRYAIVAPDGSVEVKDFVLGER